MNTNTTIMLYADTKYIRSANIETLFASVLCNRNNKNSKNHLNFSFGSIRKSVFCENSFHSLVSQFSTQFFPVSFVLYVSGLYFEVLFAMQIRFHRQFR